MKIFTTFKFMVAFLILLSPGTLHSGPDTKELHYLKEKSLANYENALNILADWTLSLNDPSMIELNVFRIRELACEPKLYENALIALAALKKNNSIAARPFLCSRIDIISGELFLRRGNIPEARRITDSLGYLEFQCTGPFSASSRGDFEREFGPEKGFDNNASFKTKTFPVSWFRTKSDLTGKININRLCSISPGSIFYFHRKINIPRNGEYYAVLGKTGYTDLLIDGEIIFRSRTRHGFCHDQYLIKVFLSEGGHEILLKTGDSYDGIKISLRITDSGGTAVKFPDEAAISQKSNRKVKYLGSDLISDFGILSGAQGVKSPFHQGYLHYASGLFSDDGSEMIQHFSKITAGEPDYPYACFYRGRAEKSPERSYELYNKSFQADPRNIESLMGMIKIKLRCGFLLETYPLIQKIKNINPLSPYYYFYLSKLFLEKGWVEEAQNNAALLRQINPFLGNRIGAQIRLKNSEFGLAEKNLEYLCAADLYDRSTINALLRCLIETGKYEEAEKKCISAVAFFPDSVRYRLTLSNIAEKRYGAGASLPYLSSALKISPYNKKILAETGIVYNKLGKKALARHFLNRALQYDPENSRLRNYLQFLNSGTEK